MHFCVHHYLLLFGATERMTLNDSSPRPQQMGVTMTRPCAMQCRDGVVVHRCQPHEIQDLYAEETARSRVLIVDGMRPKIGNMASPVILVTSPKPDIINVIFCLSISVQNSLLEKAVVPTLED